MAREVAILKRAKISQAQQYMLFSVVGAAIFLGIALSLTIHFLNKISFNASVIAKEEEIIVNYSDAIKNIGICVAPSGKIYSNEELEKCDPDSIKISNVPNTLRANILEDLSSSKTLSSVPKENAPECINSKTDKKYTNEELKEFYNNAKTTDDLVAASNLIQICSSLRIIPDALPAYKNEEALLASLNKIFVLSDWEPKQISPSGTTGASVEYGTNLNPLSLNFMIETNANTVLNVLNNIERSIRSINIESATIEWESEDLVNFQARAANAFYMDPSELRETTVIVPVQANKKGKTK